METRNSPFSNNQDRISKLPDTLIHHILSFLDMKYVIPTSLLSRRWRYLWTSLPTLNFNSKLFIPESEQYNADTDTEEAVGFVEFIDDVFILRNSSSDILRFHLVCRDCEITKRLSTWMVAAVRGNVEEIYIYTSVSDKFRFPDCLFTCESLTKMELKMDYKLTFVLPYSIHLPRLKYLDIDLGSFDDEKLTNKLFSNCPVLESLIVKGWIEQLNLNVSSHTLKHLQLINRHCEYDSIVKLNAPNLKSFVSSNLECDLENLSSLVTADITVLVFEEEKVPQTCPELYAQRLMKCLRALHNVKYLRLSTWLLEVVPGAPKFL